MRVRAENGAQIQYSRLSVGLTNLQRRGSNPLPQPLSIVMGTGWGRGTRSSRRALDTSMMDSSEGRRGTIVGTDINKRRSDRFTMAMVIRGRQPDDIDRCVEVLAEVHTADGYPMHWPADPRTWLAPDNLLGAWVTQQEDTLVGHVALCGATEDSAASVWSAASGLPEQRIAVVARLFVAPGARGHGFGAALVVKACAEACFRGLRPARCSRSRSRRNRTIRAHGMASRRERPDLMGASA